MEEEVKEECRIDETKKGAYKGRGKPLKCQIMKKQQKCPHREW